MIAKLLFMLVLASLALAWTTLFVLLGDWVNSRTTRNILRPISWGWTVLRWTLLGAGVIVGSTGVLVLLYVGTFVWIYL